MRCADDERLDPALVNPSTCTAGRSAMTAMTAMVGSGGAPNTTQVTTATPANPNVAVAAPRFTLSADGTTVEDSRTGLMWHRLIPQTYAPACPDGRPPAGGCTQLQAFTYCLESTLSNLNWRVPTLDELSSLIDRNVGSPTIDPTVFPDTPADLYWTESRYDKNLPNGDGVYYAVSFSDGKIGFQVPETDSLAVRCVRSQ